MKITQEKATKYYDRFSKVYDFISLKVYYHKARSFAVAELELRKGQTVLNLPVGTGQNFEYFQKYLNNSGHILAIDISEGMLAKAKKKVEKKGWKNISLLIGDATEINKTWLAKLDLEGLEVDAILCDLGLSGFPNWENIIDNMLSILKPNGRMVIMDWYIEKPGIRGEFINWIGKGEVNRPIWKYLKKKVANFKLDDSFNRGDVFVASGNKK